MSIWRQCRKPLLLFLLLVVLTGVNLTLIHFLSARPAYQQETLTPDAILREQKQAYERYQKLAPSGAATVVSASEATATEKAELVFTGLANAATVRTVLNTLRSGGQQATFFVSDEDAATYQDSLKLIYDAGYTIGVREDSTAAPLAGLSPEETINALIAAILRVQTQTGTWPTSLIYEGETLPSELPRCAAACGMLKIYTPNVHFKADDTDAQEQVKALMGNLRRGTLLCVELTNGGQAFTSVFATLAQALQATDLQANAIALCEQNAGSRTTALTRVFTTEKAVAFTFCGLGNTNELRNVLRTLEKRSGKAVFFITPQNLRANAEDVQAILAANQPLGIALNAVQYQSAQDAARDILQMQETLADEYGYRQTLPLKAAYGSPTAVLEEAASALGLPLVSALLSPVRADDIRATDATAIMEELFGSGKDPQLQRGEIVHFQMNQYQKSDTVLSDLVAAMAAGEYSYSLGSLMEMLNNRQAVYAYPLPDDAILPAIRDIIYPGQLKGDPLTAIQKRYIGNPYYNVTIKMPGFTAKEIKTLNQNGRIENDQNDIFLTFDDWGTDRNITHLLDVLKRHGATATFFIRTNNVHYNPNLLRAIAMEGHTIGSHTNSHLPLSNVMDTIRDTAQTLTAEQVTALKLDLVASWDTLEHVVGDVVVNGKAALTPLFRPPTLAVSKSGVEAVFDCGFHYVISGSLTTEDYSATSAEALCRKLLANTKSGAVFVMHISDTSKYTADAVDLYLTALEASKGDQYHFRGLNEVLQ